MISGVDCVVITVKKIILLITYEFLIGRFLWEIYDFLSVNIAQVIYNWATVLSVLRPDLTGNSRLLF